MKKVTPKGCDLTGNFDTTKINFCTKFSCIGLIQCLSKGRRGIVGCMSDSLCGGCGFEPHQRPPLFP